MVLPALEHIVCPWTSLCHHVASASPSIQREDWIVSPAALTLLLPLGSRPHRETTAGLAWPGLWVVGSPRPAHSPLPRSRRTGVALWDCWMTYGLIQPLFLRL